MMSNSHISADISAVEKFKAGKISLNQFCSETDYINEDDFISPDQPDILNADAVKFLSSVMAGYRRHKRKQISGGH